MSEAGKDYRIAVARRFAQRLSSGDCVLLSGGLGLGAVPCTVADGETRSLSNVNALVLMQVMRDRGLEDPRFFTAEQVETAGWALRDGAVGIGVQYLMPETKAGEPVVKRFKVFHASDVVGLAPRIEPTRVPRVSPVEVRRAVAEAVVEGGGSMEAVTLRRALVATWLEAATGVEGLRGAMVPDGTALAKWIEAAPLEFYGVVAEAEREAAHVLDVARVGQFQRIADATVARRKGDDMSTSDRLAEVDRLFEQRQAVLAVPFAEKDRAAERGAVWHHTRKVWFVPPEVDVGLFKEWNLGDNSLSATASESMVTGKFEDAMKDMNLLIPKEGIKADGKWHYARVNVKESNRRGSYLLMLSGGDDGVPRGFIVNHISGERMNWRYDGALLTPEMRSKMREEARIRAEAAAREEKEAQAAAALHAQEIFAAGVSAEGHPYVVKKGVDADGIRQISGAKLLEYEEFIGESGRSVLRPNLMYAIVPLMTERGEVRNIQAISPDGRVKSFMRGAQKMGLMFVLGAPTFESLMKSECPVLTYEEGWATGKSFRNGLPVPAVVCFDAGNMERVVQNTAGQLPPGTVKVLAVDNDQFHVERALEWIAEKVGVNPHSGRGERVQVVSRTGYEGLLHGMTREVALGDARFDGDWHQGPKGKYCASIEREADGVAVRAVKVEVIAENGRKNTSRFANRGAEVGKVCAGVAPNLVVLSPSFVSLERRPTDWNDLHKQMGMDEVQHQITDQLDRASSGQWWADLTHQSAKGGIKEARNLEDACRLLEVTKSVDEVNALVDAIDARFLRQEIAMTGQDWMDWTKAITKRTAALEHEPAVAGVER